MSNKRLIISVVVFGVFLGIPGVMGFSDLNFMPWGYLISQLYQIGIGSLFVFLMIKYYPVILWESKLFILAAACISLLLGFYIFSLLFNWLSDIHFGHWAATSVINFILPLLFWWAMTAFMLIPSEIYKIWRFPAVPVQIEMDHLDFNRMLVLELELFKNIDDAEPIKVKAKAPENMVFGNWFYKFIDDYNLKFPKSQVQFRDDYNGMHTWIFFIKTSFFKKDHYIDPDLDILHNAINEKVTIYAKRVSENDVKVEPRAEGSFFYNSNQ